MGSTPARRGANRVRYEVGDDRWRVTVIDIAYRSDAYYSGRG
jgi:mRNA-degrading endonuclease RelE of RelBE toxin-antitoxin system